MPSEQAAEPSVPTEADEESGTSTGPAAAPATVPGPTEGPEARPDEGSEETPAEPPSPRGMFGIARLRGEEREKAIAEPGLSWKEWALTTGLKPWFALLLLILDSFVLASLIEVPELTYRVVALVLLLPIVYSNVVAYLYLWARPPANLRHASKFHPTLLHPFLIGRLQPDREEWVKGSALEEATAVPPEEFV